MFTEEMFRGQIVQLRSLIAKGQVAEFNMMYACLYSYVVSLADGVADDVTQPQLDGAFAIVADVMGEDVGYLTDFPVGTYNDLTFFDTWRAEFA